MRRGPLRKFRGSKSGACGGSALGLRPSLLRLHSLAMTQVPRAARVGTADRRRRRHGRACSRARSPGLRCPEEANLRAPESVVDVHLGYIRAGAELIETNTFGANRPKLAQHFLEDEFERDQRRRGEARARGARGVGTRRLHRRLDRAARRRELQGREPAALYAEQAQILEGRGVDLFMVETFFDLDDLETRGRGASARSRRSRSSRS